MCDRKRCVILLDNGSLRASSILNLRRLAAELSARVGETVYPVSLLHSSKVEAGLLGGEKAETFVPFLRRMGESGVDDFLVIPLFFGPSGAVVEYLPAKVKELQQAWPRLSVRVAPCLVDVSDRAACAVSEALAKRVCEVVEDKNLSKPKVVVLDHGTPSRAVNQVREVVTERVSSLLGAEVGQVIAASMERREGAEYDFNEPLLERVLPQLSGDVVVAMLFLSPGRHAGEGGDVAQIIETSLAGSEQRCAMTSLLAEGDDLLPLLEERYRELAGA